MEQDCTIFQSTADETKSSQTTGGKNFQEGTHVPEPDAKTGSAIKKYSDVKAEKHEPTTNNKDCAAYDSGEDGCTSWSYIFVHNQKVKSIEDQLQKDGVTHFIHKTIKYVPRHRNRGGLREVERPSVSGLIFLQGSPKLLQSYLDARHIHHGLCKNCSTGEVATIPCNQMEPFMRIAETDPDRIRFLLRPFVYYSRNRTLLRIMTGDYAGLEGYVIRIARDRKLVMDFGGMAVAVAGVHAERFEEVDKNQATKKERATFYTRNLHERYAFIDRYFHQVKSAQEVAAQVENINILLVQTLSDVADKRLDMKDAFNTFYFMTEEINYYYAPFVDHFKKDLQPIFDAGKKVMDEMGALIGQLGENEELRQRCEAEFEELETKYGYLFE